MSKFRVELDVSFDTEKEAKALLNMVEKFKGKAYRETGAPRSLMVVTKCRYHECFHDEVPPKPCGAYVTVDFTAAEVQHTYVTGEGTAAKQIVPKNADLIAGLGEVSAVTI